MPIAHPSPSPPPQVESNFNSYHQFLMQALVYLDSPNRRLKLTAMKFISRCGHCPIHVKPKSRALRSTGSASRAPAPCPCLRPSAAPTLPPAGGILQDYFTDVCFYLKKGDVKTLKKCERRATLSRMGTALMLECLSPSPGWAVIFPLRTDPRTGRELPTPPPPPYVGPGDRL